MEISQNKIILEIYKDINGKTPFIEWLESIKDITTRAKIKNRLRRIELGNFGDYKSLGEGVFELRLQFKAGYRVYFGKVGNKIVLLLCGGDKKSQPKEIKRAKGYWKDYKK
jgi:putative addiction module killer protein